MGLVTHRFAFFSEQGLFCRRGKIEDVKHELDDPKRTVTVSSYTLSVPF